MAPEATRRLAAARRGRSVGRTATREVGVEQQTPPGPKPAPRPVRFLKIETLPFAERDEPPEDLVRPGAIPYYDRVYPSR